MENKIGGRYIDPMLDWSFKRLFGTEMNKDILMSFLNVVFPGAGIDDITYVPSEQLGMMESDRKAVFDVLCRTADGRTFLVEMQRCVQKNFYERALFYSSFPILKQGRRAGMDGVEKYRTWDYSLDGVFFLGILNFRFEDDDMLEHRYRLLETTTGKPMTDKYEFVYVEVPKFDKGVEELESDLDKWLFVLKNMSGLLERPAQLRDRIFKRIFDVAEIADFDASEQENYIKAMNTERDTYNQIAYAREEGMKSGIAQGMERGIAQGIKQGISKGIEQGVKQGRDEEKTEIARRMLALGLTVEVISEATGLSLEELKAISAVGKPL